MISLYIIFQVTTIFRCALKNYLDNQKMTYINYQLEPIFYQKFLYQKYLTLLLPEKVCR